MKSYIKIFIVLLIFLICMLPISFATDINMNLPLSEEENTISNETNSITEELNATNTETSNTLAEDNLEDSILADTPSTTISSTSLDESLSFDTILNILLIVIGIILVLLGIAILIRVH